VKAYLSNSASILILISQVLVLYYASYSIDIDYGNMKFMFPELTQIKIINLDYKVSFLNQQNLTLL
jgi:hypothetical protein